MAGYHSLIGYPWIIGYLTEYDSASVKQKSVPCQVVEILKMPDRSINLEDSQCQEAVVNISDQQYYIRAVITKEAQRILESDGHFTLANIKNKIIILRKFSVCFTAVEDLTRCEFYLTVQDFNLVAMETNTVYVKNCNMEKRVRNKIVDLWKKYMKELEKNETSSDMNISDVSLTQLLMVASEEKFSALKSIAEQCLDTFTTQDVPPQCRTLWSKERIRTQESTEKFIPVGLLLIPPHEEALLKQITATAAVAAGDIASATTGAASSSSSALAAASAVMPLPSAEPSIDNRNEFRHEGPCTSELAESSEGDNSSQPYSTALSTLSDEPIDEGPSSQSGNPWNQLESICVSVATSSDSQPKCSASVAQKNEVRSDPDSSTPDIFPSDADVSMGNSPNGESETSPLMFSEHSSHPQQPSTSLPRTDSASSNTSPDSRQGRSVNTSIASLNLIPLTQDSPQRSVSVGSKVQISPIKSYTSESKSSPAIIRDLFSLSDESNRGKYCSPRTRKASKRKQMSEDLEHTLSDLQQEENPDYESSGEETCEVFDNVNGGQTAVSKQIGRREAAVPVSDMEKNDRKTEQSIKKHITQKHNSSRKRIQAHKPSLQFEVHPKVLTTKDSAIEKITAKSPAANKLCREEAPSEVAHGQPLSFQAKEKSRVPIIDVGKYEQAHRDGTPFQYKYKPPSEDLCTRMNAIQIPADLCEWAVKMLSEGPEKVL